MKNFLDLQDIKTLRVKIKLTPVSNNGNPVVMVQVNNKLFDYTPISNQTEFDVTVDIDKPVAIKIGLKDKQYSAELETAVIIDSIRVDNVELANTYNHRAVYINDHNYQEPTNYIGFNGVWELNTEKPFYQWLHNVSGQGWLLEPI